MALIICKGCGGRVSTRATVCPKCGCPVSESMAGQRDESLRDSATANESSLNTATPHVSKAKPSARPSVASPFPDDIKPKRSPWAVIAIVIVLLVVAGGGYFAYDKHQKALAEETAIAEQHRQDSIAEAKALAEQAEAARQDSLKKVNMTTPDMDMCELHGDVKSLSPATFSFPDYKIKKYDFDSDGSWTHNSIRGETIQRDEDGHITNWKYTEGAGFQRGLTFKWLGNNVASLTEWGWEWNYVDVYTYDSNGYCIKVVKTGGCEVGEDNSTTVYSGYIVDEVGNWVERKYKETYTHVCIMHSEYDPYCEDGECERGTKSGVEKRTITYYTQRESKRQTIEEYLASKNQ